VNEPFHSVEELRARVGTIAIFFTPVALSMKCERLRGRLARVRRVLRTNVELDFEGAGVWRWPYAEVVLQSHPFFQEGREIETRRARTRPRSRRVRKERTLSLFRAPRRPRDAQRQRLYDWEHVFIRPRDTTARSLDECQRWVDRLRADAGLRRPIVVGDGRGSKRARWIPADRRIELPLWARRKYVVLHEMAHAICDERNGQTESRETIAAHGAEFLRIYVDLLAEYLGLDRGFLEESVSEVKLRIAAPRDPDDPSVRPPQLRLFRLPWN
jgi:putative metallohydrolase (TIGR04338 family)